MTRGGTWGSKAGPGLESCELPGCESPRFPGEGERGLDARGRVTAQSPEGRRFKEQRPPLLPDPGVGPGHRQGEGVRGR